MNILTNLRPNPNGPIPTLLLFGCMLCLFYFLLIRPQAKIRKQIEERLSRIKIGDEVILASGLYVTIDRIEDKIIYIKLGNAIVKVKRNAIVGMANEDLTLNK